MKTVRITYRYSDITPSVPLLLFFRMIGIYVSERFFNQKLGFKQEFDSINFNTCSTLCNAYDADILLISHNDDLYEYDWSDKNTILVCCGANLPDEVKRSNSFLMYSEGSTHGDEKLIEDILELFKKKN